MILPRVVGISGNLRRPSRTRALVEAVAAALADQREIDLSVYDLLDAGPGLGAAYTRTELTLEAAGVVEAIETADALVVGVGIRGRSGCRSSMRACRTSVSPTT